LAAFTLGRVSPPARRSPQRHQQRDAKDAFFDEINNGLDVEIIRGRRKIVLCNRRFDLGILINILWLYQFITVMRHL